jgi:hypothetical protein
MDTFHLFSLQTAVARAQLIIKDHIFAAVTAVARADD